MSNNANLTIPKYYATHQWMYKNYGKANKCEDCGDKEALAYDWANISKTYKREREDWKQLCRSCHQRFDMTPEKKARLKQISKLEKPKSWKPISMHNNDGEIISIFESQKKAAKATGISKTAINNVIRGLSRTAGGYVWRMI